MKHHWVLSLSALVVVAVLASVRTIHGHFTRELAVAVERAGQDSVVLTTGCGPIEVQQVPA